MSTAQQLVYQNKFPFCNL